LTGGVLARGRRVRLRHASPADRAEYVEALHRSRTLLEPWVDVDLDEAAIAAWLDGADRPDSQRLLVIREQDGAIAGHYSISQIFMGSFRSAYLGYAAFEPFAGHGYMSEAMPLLCRYAFGPLELHRLQANVQPGNERSLALLRATGWREEGYAEKYLMISGDWRDHVTFAITAEDLGAIDEPTAGEGPRDRHRA
jgi:ribosomal-protein-alanine N-acetyltransferase